MKLDEKTIEKKYIYKGRIINVRTDTAELPNGKQALREVVEHPGGVTVAALTDNDELMFVRQFRYPYSEVLLELPAGKLEYGEDPFEAGKRELREETGLRLTAITHVLPPAACTVGIGDERTVCVFGTAEGTFRPSADPMEEIESAWYTRAQVRALHETDLFGSWALAYSWMFANGCLPGV